MKAAIKGASKSEVSGATPHSESTPHLTKKHRKHEKRKTSNSRHKDTPEAMSTETITKINNVGSLSFIVRSDSMQFSSWYGTINHSHVEPSITEQADQLVLT